MRWIRNWLGIVRESKHVRWHLRQNQRSDVSKNLVPVVCDSACLFRDDVRVAVRCDRLTKFTSVGPGLTFAAVRISKYDVSDGNGDVEVCDHR